MNEYGLKSKCIKLKNKTRKTCLEELYESSEDGGRRRLAAGSALIQGSAHSSPRPSRPSLPRPSLTSRPSRLSTSARCTITSRDERTRL